MLESQCLSFLFLVLGLYACFSIKIHRWLEKYQQIYRSHKFPVYYLQCSPCPAGDNIIPHYIGSSANTNSMKIRWQYHKYDLVKGLGKDCGFCKHWKQYHGANYTDLSPIKVYILYSCANPGRKEDDWPQLRMMHGQLHQGYLE